MRRIAEKKAELQRIREASSKLSTRNPQQLRRYIQLKEDSQRLHNEINALEKEQHEKVQKLKELRRKIDSIKSKDKHAKRTRKHLKKEYEMLQRELANADTSPNSKDLLANITTSSESSRSAPRVIEIEQPVSLKEGRLTDEEEEDEEVYGRSPDQFGLREQAVVANQTERHIKKRVIAEKELERNEKVVSKQLERIEKEMAENIRRESELAKHSYESAMKGVQTKSSRRIDALSERLADLEALANRVEQRKQKDMINFSKLQLSKRTFLIDIIALVVSLLRNTLFFIATIRDRFFYRRQQSQQ
ncbi:hypothetical protein Tcan_03901 [Toxocara canis]|uniref:Uncharacterized protein n=1 Tax=Toxocara canis TaxID=6265 RepID=A0A0B2UTX9_TOXCA|nr:hypothetical protein Tcan_03901 [Toxocara canis]